MLALPNADCIHPFQVNTQKRSHARDLYFSRIVVLFHNLRCEAVMWVWCLPLACHQGRTAPNTLKQILFYLFTSVIWGLSAQKLMPAFYGKNSTPASSCCTPVLCVWAFLGVHTQVKVSYISWSETATRRQPLQISWHSITYYLSQQLWFACLYPCTKGNALRFL